MYKNLFQEFSTFVLIFLQNINTEFSGKNENSVHVDKTIEDAVMEF